MSDKKTLLYYLELNYSAVVTRFEDDDPPYYEAEIPNLPGCGASGKDRNEALERLDEAKEVWLEARLKRGLSIPEPVSEDEFSGNYPLRISPIFHMQLTRNAKKEGLSLNQYIKKKLESTLNLETILTKLEGLSQKVEKIERISESRETTTSYPNVTQATRFEQGLNETAADMPSSLSKSDKQEEEEKSGWPFVYKEA